MDQRSSKCQGERAIVDDFHLVLDEVSGSGLLGVSLPLPFPGSLLP